MVIYIYWCRCIFGMYLYTQPMIIYVEMFLHEEIRRHCIILGNPFLCVRFIVHRLKLMCFYNCVTFNYDIRFATVVVEMQEAKRWY